MYNNVGIHVLQCGMTNFLAVRIVKEKTMKIEMVFVIEKQRSGGVAMVSGKVN